MVTQVSSAQDIYPMSLMSLISEIDDLAHDDLFS